MSSRFPSHGVQCRKINNQVSLNLNKNAIKPNSQLRQLLSTDTQTNPYNNPDPETILPISYFKSSKQTASHKFISSVTRSTSNQTPHLISHTTSNHHNNNKENINDVNLPTSAAAIKKKKNNNISSNTQSLSKVIFSAAQKSKDHTHEKVAKKKDQSPGSSNDKKAKSLNRFEQKLKNNYKTVSGATTHRKSLSPQATSRAHNKKQPKSRPVTAYTSRDVRGQTMRGPQKQGQTINFQKALKKQQRVFREDSPNISNEGISNNKKKNTKRKTVHQESVPQHTISTNKPLLDIDSIGIARQLHKMNEKSLHTNRQKKNKSVTASSTTRREQTHRATNYTATLGATKKSGSKGHTKSKKKVVVSHNNSKQAKLEYPVSSSKDEVLDLDQVMLPRKYRETHKPSSRLSKKQPKYLEEIRSPTFEQQQSINIKSEPTSPTHMNQTRKLGFDFQELINRNRKNFDQQSYNMSSDIQNTSEVAPIENNNNNDIQDLSLNEAEKEDLAATKIQKVFRGYITRKHLASLKKLMYCIVTIQRFVRGYLARLRYKKMTLVKKKPHAQLKIKIPVDQSLCTVKDFNIQAEQMSQPSLEIVSTPSSRKVDMSDQKMKQKIKKLLDHVDTSSEKSMTLSNNPHNISTKLFPSPKNRATRMPKEIDLPLIRSVPKPDSSSLSIESPATSIMETLPILQRVHRQKLINVSNMQKEALQKLYDQKQCSPMTLQIKSKEIDERLQYEIERFQKGIRQVMRGWNLTNEEPSQFFSSPEPSYVEIKKKSEIRSEQNKNLINAFKQTFEDQYPNSDRKLEDLSVELSEYCHQNTDTKSIQSVAEYKKLSFDSSMVFVDRYLEALLEFLDKEQQWKESFIEEMKTPANVSLAVLLKNLGCLTEDSQQDSSFKLPLYKYLVYEVKPLISPSLISQFHRSHPQIVLPNDSLQNHLLMSILDCLNEELHKQRPRKKLLEFEQMRYSAKVHPSLLARSDEMTTEQLLFHNYMAFAYEEVLRSASQQCGLLEQGHESEQEYRGATNQFKINQIVKSQVLESYKNSLCFPEQEIQSMVAVSDQAFLAIIDEAISEFSLFMKLK